MARRAPAPPTAHQELLDRLAVSFKDHHGGDGAKRHAPPAQRVEAVDAALAGVPLAAIAKVTGVSAWTLSRWLKASPSRALPPPLAIRELTLVPTPRPADLSDGSAALFATLKLPGGIQIDLPVAALTAGFIGQLLTVGGAP